MSELNPKQCICGSKAFLGRRCALCNEALPESFFQESPFKKTIRRFLNSPILHLTPFWLIYCVLIVSSDKVWIPNEKGDLPAIIGAALLGLVSLGYLAAPLVTFVRGRGMRMPTQSDQKVAVYLVKATALLLMILMTISMIGGRIPLIMQ